LTRRKEALKTLENQHVKIYACGVTVYDHCHIGHAMQAIFFDVIRQYLKFAGYRVTYVRNYTDVDDKIINRAQERGISPAKLAKDMIESCDRDMMAIGVNPPDKAPKVSEMIPQIIAMTQQLIDKKFAYATKDGDVYYRVRSKADYGKLSGRNPDDMRTGTRELVAGDKEDPLDFALWKSDTTPEASWPSQWGVGRPGWHIECSAMAKAILGDSFDIHGGGRDLIFPHHENEIAQSEAANSCGYATAWLHCGLLTINKQKMSKSLGNHISITDFLRDWPAEVLRLAFLQHSYGSNIDFSPRVFAEARRRLHYYYQLVASLETMAAEHQGSKNLLKDHTPALLTEEFHQVMSDDFNSAAAIAAINRSCRKAGELARGKSNADRSATASAYLQAWRPLWAVLGIVQEPVGLFISKLKEQLLGELQITPAEIQVCIDQRQQARAAKDFATSDQLRKDMAARGIDLMDTPSGTKWDIRYDADANQ